MSSSASLRGLWRYTAAGGVATASHYLLAGALIVTRDWTPGLASMIGAVVGAVVGFGLNHVWAFAGHGVPHRRVLLRFMVLAAIGAPLHGGLVWGGTALLGTHWLAAQAAATFVLLLAGYAANRHWSFSGKG